jgi:hypothetical protein
MKPMQTMKVGARDELIQLMKASDEANASTEANASSESQGKR